jgi:hypothetical protein
VYGRNLIRGLTSAASPRVDISGICKVGQKLGMSLPLLTCSPLAWPSRLLYRRGLKSWKVLWITMYYKFRTLGGIESSGQRAIVLHVRIHLRLKSGFWIEITCSRLPQHKQ